jgi:hypothetical protein
MFSDEDPFYLLSLPLFHLVLPSILSSVLIRQGYNPTHLLLSQTLLAWTELRRLGC